MNQGMKLKILFLFQIQKYTVKYMVDLGVMSDPCNPNTNEGREGDHSDLYMHINMSKN